MNVLEPEILHTPSDTTSNKRVDLILITNSGEKVAEKMWTPRDRTNLIKWPKMWLPIDLKPFQCRVLEVRYTIDSWEWMEMSSPLLYHSVRVILQLEEIFAREQRRNPVVFLSYGFGGFLVKQIILTLKNGPPRFEKFYKSVVGTIFYSSPHRAEFSYHLRDLILSSQLIVPDPPKPDLEANCQYFLYMSEQLCRINHISCLSFVESQAADSQKVVPLQSADLGKGEFYILHNYGYRHMTRPATREDLGYLCTIRFIKQCVDKNIARNDTLINVPLKADNSAVPRSFSIWLKDRNVYLTEGTTESDFESIENCSYKVLFTESYESLFVILTKSLNFIVNFLGVSPADMLRGASSGQIAIRICGEQRESKLAFAFLCHSLALPLQQQCVTVKDIASLCPYELLRNETLAKDERRILDICNLLGQMFVKIDAEDTNRGTNQHTSEVTKSLMEVLAETKKLLNQKPKIAVIGRPNAGKSTLLNSLLFQNILPVDHAECTAVSIEIAAAATIEEQTTEIRYKTKHEWCAMLEELQVALGDVVAELSVLSQPDVYNTNLEKIRSKQEEISAKEKFLVDFKRAAESLSVGGTEQLPGILLEKMSITNIYSFLMKEVKIYVYNSKLLANLTLVDTPGLKGSIDKNPHVMNTLKDPTLDGWIYLTRFDDADGDQVAEDLRLLHKHSNNIPGLCVISKFDQCTSINPLEDTLVPKRRVIQAANGGKNAPACSALVMAQVSSTLSQGNAALKKYASEADKLAARHVGQFFYERVQQQNTEAEEEEEEDITQMGASAPIATSSIPTATCTLSNFCGRAPSLFKDVAMESSMFVPLVRRIHQMVYKTVKTECMTQVLEKINRIVTTKLVQLEKEIDDRENEYTIFGNLEKQKQLLAGHVEQQRKLNKRGEDAKKELWKIQQDMQHAVKQLQVELEMFASDSFIADKTAAILKTISAKRGSLWTTSVPIYLSQQFDRFISQKAESCINYAVDTAILKEMLLSSFPTLIHTAEVLVQSLTARMDCAVPPPNVVVPENVPIPAVFYTERLFQSSVQAKARFHEKLIGAAKTNAKIIIKFAVQHLNYIYARVASLVEDDIRRIKGEETKEARRVKELEYNTLNGNIHWTEPRNVVRNRLDLLRFRYTLLSKLYADLSSIYLPCIIADHHFPEFTDFGTLLTRKELRYIRIVYELYNNKQVGVTRSSALAPKASFEKSRQLILETFNNHLLKEDSEAVPLKDIKSEIATSKQYTHSRAIVVLERRIGVLVKSDSNIFILATPFYPNEEMNIDRLTSKAILMVLVQQ